MGQETDQGAGPVRRWLMVWAVMVAATVVIGGITRLTESGLSITEWKPVTGVVPPLSTAAWQAEFAKYQQIPEYRQFGAGMTLADFQRIYFWEYLHRLWARIVGLAFLAPFLWFLARRRIPQGYRGRLWLLLLLLAGQGALGWFMVKSGLTQRTDVSQYRLAAHLGLALVIFALAVWTTADLWPRRNGSAASVPPWLVHSLMAGAALVLLTALAGAFVAGLDAGRAYNTFPLMGGRLVPSGYFALTPWYRNLFENGAAVQFNHRVLGLSVVLMAVGIRLALPAETGAVVRRLVTLMAAAALGQMVLGILTLLFAVPVALGAVHQAGAVVVFTCALLAAHAGRSAGRARPLVN